MAGMSFHITGRVQGVGFRAFVRETANRLGVTGQVFNARDGSVQGYAFHAEEAVLHQFGAALVSGPGQVDRVMSVPCEGSAISFEISASR